MKITILFPLFIFFVIVIDYGLSSKKSDAYNLRRLIGNSPGEEVQKYGYSRQQTERQQQQLEAECERQWLTRVRMQAQTREVTDGLNNMNLGGGESSLSRVGGHSNQQTRQEEINYQAENEKYIIHKPK